MKENNNQDEEHSFNHSKAGVSDKIAFIGELEHLRRHALRSAVSVHGTEDEFNYLILAQQAQTIRREYMRVNFPEIKDRDWCLCKTAACLRQLSYELFSSDKDPLKEIDDLVDNVWGNAIKKDLTDCEACRSDKES